MVHTEDEQALPQFALKLDDGTFSILTCVSKPSGHCVLRQLLRGNL